jgi:hypothetical protein
MTQEEAREEAMHDEQTQQVGRFVVLRNEAGSLFAPAEYNWRAGDKVPDYLTDREHWAIVERWEYDGVHWQQIA